MRMTAAGRMSLLLTAALAASVGAGCGGLGVYPDAGNHGGSGGAGGSGGSVEGTGGAGTGGDTGSGGEVVGSGGSTGSGGAVVDSGVDMAPVIDAPADRAADVPRDAGTDTAADAPVDHAPEAAPEAAGDVATEAASDAGDSGGEVFFPVEPCPDPEDYTVKDGDTATVGFAPFSYAPQCLKVAKGTMVTFSGTFADFPLAADTPLGTDAATPIVDTGSGLEATFSFANPGFYPYHCVGHEDLDMIGVIWVTN